MQYKIDQTSLRGLVEAATKLQFNIKIKMPATRITQHLTLDAARAATAACEAKAREIGVPMNIAVVDASTHLLAFSR